MTSKQALRISSIAILAALAFANGAPLQASGWGDMTGHFVIDGAAPAAKPVNVDKDQAVCTKVKLFDESVTVDDKGNLQNALVFLRTEKVEPHPDYAKSAKDTIVLDNLNCRFEPHVVTLRTTQSLEVKNSDPIGHNTKADPLNTANKPINPILQAGGTFKIDWTGEERIPFKVGCNIHSWMGGYVLVRTDPYMAVSDKDGKFTIKNLPAGKELEFQLWQEKAGYLKDAAPKGAKVDSKGRMKITLKEGANDLGDIKIPAGAFLK